MTRAGRLARLEGQRQAGTLWEALPEDLRGQVTREALERAAEDAPDGVRRDREALALWAYLYAEGEEGEA